MEVVGDNECQGRGREVSSKKQFKVPSTQYQVKPKIQMQTRSNSEWYIPNEFLRCHHEAFLAYSASNE